MSEERAQPPSLEAIVADLAGALEEAGVAYALTGSAAMPGVAGAAGAVDVEVLVDLGGEQPSHVTERLMAAGFARDPDPALRDLATQQLARFHRAHVSVYVVPAVIPLFDQVIRRGQRQPVGGRQVQVATPEDLAVLKLVTSSGLEDARDVLPLLETGSLDMGYVRTQVRRHLSDGDPRLALLPDTDRPG